jgi:hypothetical protein
MPIPLATLDASAWWSGSSPMPLTAGEPVAPVPSTDAPASERAPVIEAPKQTYPMPEPKRPNYGPPA